MRIARVETSNVMGCRVAYVEPTATGLQIVAGENDTGKSSFLASMMMAIEGAGAVTEVPMTKGEARASVRVTMVDDDGNPALIATRRWKLKGPANGTLYVEDADGAPQSSPQALLDKLRGALSFDAEDFRRMEPKQRAQVVRELAGLDFTEIDSQIEGAFAKRRDAKRDLATAEERLVLAPAMTDVPAKRVSVTDLAEQRLAAERRRELAAQEVAAHSAAEEQLAYAKRGMDAAREALRTAEHEHTALVEACAAARELARRATSEAPTDEEIEEITERLQGAEAANDRHDAQARHEQARRDVIQKQAAADSLHDELEKLREERADVIRKADLPVEGLGFDGDTLTFDGLPYDQRSASDQRRIAVAIGAKMNPGLHFMTIRDGSLLGKVRQEEVAKLAEEFDLQVWFEVVGEDERALVTFEEGVGK